MPRLQVRMDVVEQGYTGQRDAWEDRAHDATVTLEDKDTVQFLFPGNECRRIRFDRVELEEAVRMLAPIA